MRKLQVVPKDGANLYGDMVAKEIQLAQRKVGTLHRTGPKQKDRANGHTQVILDGLIWQKVLAVLFASK